jgi:hypothetical protein
MTKTTKSQRPTAEQIARGWKAIERQALGPVAVTDRIEIGSTGSAFDAPPAWPTTK